MIACTFPGKIGDCLYALPTIKELCRINNDKVDFYTSEYCRPLENLFRYQSFINDFIVPKDYIIKRYDMGIQPWYIPVERSKYNNIYQLGFKYVPDRALYKFIAHSVGLDYNDLKVEYEYPKIETSDKPYIVVAPRGKTSYDSLFIEVINKCPIDSVIIGGVGDYIGVGIDKTGLDFLYTLPWVANAKAFVGLMSSQLALANGFNIRKIIPYDGKSWDMRHVIYDDSIEYLVNPTANHVLERIKYGS